MTLGGLTSVFTDLVGGGGGGGGGADGLLVAIITLASAVVVAGACHLERAELEAAVAAVAAGAGWPFTAPLSSIGATIFISVALLCDDLSRLPKWKLTNAKNPKTTATIKYFIVT